MSLLHRTALFLLLAIGLIAATAAQPLDGLRDKMIRYLASAPPDTAQVQAWMIALAADGTWPDVDYDSEQRGGWPTALHLDRIRSMTQAWAAPASALHGDAALLAAIHRGLDNWLKNDYQCPNWWHNQINVPWMMGDILLMLGPSATPGQRATALGTIMPRAKIGMTGQNRIWVSANVLRQGLLLDDAAMVSAAIESIAGEIVVRPAEGIQADWSFHQHGPQAQFGNYGLSYANDCIQWLGLFQDTPFALPVEKQEIARHYLLEGLAWTVWQGRMDVSSCGRQIHPDTQARKGGSALATMRRAQKVDPTAKQAYAAAVASTEAGGVNRLTGNRDFWRSDYVIQRQSGFMASLKMCSRRVIGAESLNSENLLGYHLADGVTCFYTDGKDYEDIFPVWDWQKLPGTTCVQLEKLPRFGNMKMDSDFVGAVSDGKTGCAAMAYTRDGLTGHKAWFFMGDTVVCLGAGFTQTGERPVVTTVDQRRLTGAVEIATAAGRQTLEPGAHTLDGLRWASTAGMGYLFPEGGALRLENQPRTGNWRSVQDTTVVPSRDVTEEVFLLYFDHGQAAEAAGYAYAVYPGADAEAMAARAGQPDFTILRRTPELMAVAGTGTGWVGAAFFAPGALELPSGAVVATDQPCLVQFEPGQPQPAVWVADPTQKLKSLTLTWNGQPVAVTLPEGTEAGRSVRLPLPAGTE